MTGGLTWPPPPSRTTSKAPSNRRWDGGWGFPLPWAESDPLDRGWRIARAALQEAWKEEADRRPITQITPPQIVHEFIAAQPGLAETCRENLRYLLAYAPQLVVRGFGGEFEDTIEDAYQRSLEVGPHEP